MNVKKYERYINNDLLSCIQRPQPYNYCSLTCIQEILLYFNQYYEYSELLEKINWNHKDIIEGKIGNQKIIEALKKFDLIGIIYNKFKKIEWNELKKEIKDGFPMIYHRKGHYSLVVGYIEEPFIKNNGDIVEINNERNQKWLVLGEHRVKSKTTRELGMIELVSWKEYQNMISMKQNYGLIFILKSLLQ